MRKLFLLAFVLLLSTGCVDLSTDKLTIGGIAPLTGKKSERAIKLTEVINLRIKQWNKAGGVNGRQVEIIWKDGECTESGGERAARELIKEHSVSVIIGGLCSEETIGAAKVTEKERVILFTPVSTASEITELGDYVFRGAVSNTRQAQKILEQIRKQKYAKVGVLIESRAYSEDLLEIVRSKYDGEIVVSRVDPSNVSKSLEDVDSEDVDAIFFIIGTPGLLRLTFNEIENLSWQDRHFLFDKVPPSLDVLEEEFSELLSKNHVTSVIFVLPIDTPKFSEYKTQYLQEYGRDLQYYKDAVSGLDGTDVLLGVLDEVDDINRAEEIRSLLLRIQIPGFFSGIMFDENGDLDADYSVLKFIEDKFQILD